MYYQHLATTNNVNGNPRRLFVVYDQNGRVIEVIDEGYEGTPDHLRGMVQLGGHGDRVAITPAEYKRWKQRGKAGGRRNPSARYTPRHNGRTAFDRFFQGYVDCALWSSTDNADESGGQPLDRNYTQDEIARETLAQMYSDCERFYNANADDLVSISDSQAGHDFWLSRNGHGAGFWDRGNGALGDRLHRAAKAFGEYNLYIGDDGRIHGM